VRLSAVLILGLCLLAACDAGPREPADVESDGIRIALRSDLRGTDPGVNRDAVTDDVLLHIVESLVAYTSDFEVKPLLAEEVERSASGTEYVFHLRKGVRFHNGEQLTSAEVAWSWRRILDPATGWLCRNWYDGSSGLEVVDIRTPDRLTVVFELAKANALFLDRMASLQCIPPILHPDSVGADGTWVQPIGTGPYRLEAWRRGQEVELAAFEHYQPAPGPRDGMAGERLALETTLSWIVVPDPSAAKAGLLSDQLDIIYNVDATDAMGLESENSVALHSSSSLNWNVLLVQTRHPVLSDVGIRRGIAHAIDRAGIAAVVTSGISGRNPSIVPSVSRYHSECHDEHNRYDPERARELLVGLKGHTLKIQTNRRYPNMYDAALMIHAMLLDIGVSAELEVLEWATQMRNYMEGDFELMTFGYSGRPDPTLGYEAVTGDKTEAAFYQWQDAEAMRLIRKSAEIANPTHRAEIFCRLHRRMIRQVPMINLFNHYGIDATRRTVRGFEPWAGRKPRLWGVSRDGSVGEADR